MRNVEIKAVVKCKQSLIEKAKSLSGQEGVAITQNDTFFNVPQGRLKLRKFENGSGELIYYERSDTQGPKLCSFEKSDITRENVLGLEGVLSRALDIQTVVRKVRQLFLVGQTRIHIDCVEGLGDFMELEVVLKENQTSEEGQNIAFNLMKELEISKEDLIAGAYADLQKK